MSNFNLAIPGGAALIGAVIGYGLNEGDPDAHHVATQVDGISAQVETLAADKAALAALAEETGGLTAALAELRAENAKLAEAIGDIGGRLDALAGADATVSDGLAALGSQVQALEGAVGATGDTVSKLDSEMRAARERMAAMHQRHHGDDGGEDQQAATTPAAPAQETPAPSKDDLLAEAAGPDGLSLSVGQTGTVGGAKVFLSRMTGETAKLLVIGGAAVEIGKWTGPADIGNGCTLTYVGEAAGKLYLKPAC